MKSNSNCRNLSNPNANCPVCFAASTQNFSTPGDSTPICLPLNTIITCSNSVKTCAGNSEIFITQPGIYQINYFIVGKRRMKHYLTDCITGTSDSTNTSITTDIDSSGSPGGYATFTFSIFKNDKKLVREKSEPVAPNGCDTISNSKTFSVSCNDLPTILSLTIKTESAFTFDYFITIQKITSQNCRKCNCSSDSQSGCNCF